MHYVIIAGLSGGTPILPTGHELVYIFLDTNRLISCVFRAVCELEI